MIRALVDSSVFVSAAIGNPSSPPSAVFEAWEDVGFELIVSPKLLHELSGVLRRPKFERYLEARDVDELLARLEPARPSSRTWIQAGRSRAIRMTTTS